MAHSVYRSYVSLLNLRVAKVSEILKRSWRHRRLNQLPRTLEWMRKGEGQGLHADERAWASATAIPLPQSADCEDPVTWSACCCRYAHYPLNPEPGMRFTVGIFLSRRQVRMLFVREIWPDPVAHHLPPSASAEIFHERKVPRGPEKRRTIWEMCFSTGTPFDETLTSHVPSHSGKNILIISTKTQQKLSFRIKRNFSWL